AWPHLLSLKSKGAPITLQPGPANLVSAAGTAQTMKAGVFVLSPPPQGPLLASGGAKPSGPPWPDFGLTGNGGIPEGVIPDGDKWVPYTGQTNVFKHRARVDLVVVFDGQIVDTNRIAFPKDAPILRAPAK